MQTQNGFHLQVLDQAAQDGQLTLPVPPAGITWLKRGTGGRPRLDQLAPRTARRYAIEPWCPPQMQPALILAAPNRRIDAWINGEPALPLAILHSGDELLLEYLAAPLFVTQYRSPWVGPAPARKIGSVCPVCRSPVQADTRIYLCPCGTPVHAEGEEKGEDYLACRDVVDASPVCRQAVLLQPGYTHTPDAS